MCEEKAQKISWTCVVVGWYLQCDSGESDCHVSVCLESEALMFRLLPRFGDTRSECWRVGVALLVMLRVLSCVPY